MRNVPTNKPAAPVVHTPTILVPQGNGEFLVKPGRPVVMDEEIRTRDFAHLTGLSVRYVNQLCDEGTIKSRRMSARPKSHYLIPRSEVGRYLESTKAER